MKKSSRVSCVEVYRADGMRVSKLAGGVATRYRHDGQMGMEDVETQGANTVVTRYGLGARGVDLIERTAQGGAVTTGFPLYDAHGNNVATLSRSGTGYSVNDRRSYDAWGVVRAQQSGGDPKLRYCASLGHKQDDESGLIYMRARYYEPTSGRFVSQDPGRHRSNWYVYCADDPVNRIDHDGRLDQNQIGATLAALWAILSQFGGPGGTPKGNVFNDDLPTEYTNLVEKVKREQEKADGADDNATDWEMTVLIIGLYASREIISSGLKAVVGLGLNVVARAQELDAMQSEMSGILLG